MRWMKRMMAVIISAALLCPVTANAAQSEEALAFYKQTEASMNALTDLNAFYDFHMNMSGSLLEKQGIPPVDMRMEMNVKMTNLQNPEAIRYMSYSRMTVPNEDPVIASSYYADGVLYSDSMGQKVKVPMDVGAMMEQALSASAAFASEDLIQDLNLWDEGENKVIGYTISDSRMNEYMDMVLGSTGLTGLFDTMEMKLSNINGEYVVDPQGQCIKMRMKMSMDMTMNGETMTVTIDGDIGIADPGQPVEVPMPDPAEYTEVSMEDLAGYSDIAP